MQHEVFGSVIYYLSHVVSFITGQYYLFPAMSFVTVQCAGSDMYYGAIRALSGCVTVQELFQVVLYVTLQCELFHLLLCHVMVICSGNVS